MSQMRTEGSRINKLAGSPVVEGVCDDDDMDVRENGNDAGGSGL